MNYPPAFKNGWLLRLSPRFQEGLFAGSTSPQRVLWQCFAVAVWLVTRPTIPATNSAVTPSAEQLLAEVPTETLVDYLLLAEVDVMTTAALSEAEQAELLEQLNVGDLANELLFNDTNDEDD